MCGDSWITIMNRALTSRWRKTRPKHDLCIRRDSDVSSQFRKSAAFTTGTNAGRLEGQTRYVHTGTSCPPDLKLSGEAAGQIGKGNARTEKGWHSSSDVA